MRDRTATWCNTPIVAPVCLTSQWERVFIPAFPTLFFTNPTQYGTRFTVTLSAHNDSRSSPPTKGRLAQLLRGWKLGLFVVVSAALMLAIVTPRPALPDSIPLPIPNYSRIDALQRTDKHLAQSVYANPLPEQVRQLSEYFRQFGWTASKRDPVAARIARTVITRYLDQVRDKPEQLCRLRAFHTYSFIKELRALQHNPQPSRELYELCGDFLQTMTESGWLLRNGETSRLIVPEPVAIVLYRIRWNDIVAVNAPELRIDIEEQRLLHAFLFSHPATRLRPVHDPASRQQLDYQYLLNKIPTYARIDPDYPADYATAIVLLHLGRPQQAVAPLTAYLQRHPDGPHTLRVRNALRYAQNQLHLGLIQNRPLQNRPIQRP